MSRLELEIPSLDLRHGEGDGVLVLPFDRVIELIDGRLPAVLGGRPLGEMRERVSTMAVLDDRVLLADQIRSAASNFDEEPSEMAADLLEWADSTELLAGPTWYLSAGETTLARLAVALARPFELLLLLEPFAGLDARRRAAASELLEAVAMEHLVVLSDT